ncbi:MAG: 50S ribosomal protein L5 [Candidatus Portnoybacteria bacterium RBG_13_40_8]|uniref:Large ribosomal subunit protein uL5 n=1 Tax=Candidatus Portnoybacteria bacterium RBG_13_40_8 TaxID=1801990 RepID=A0A1G2F571_9BACT|nr:MAG: 50S ribosomal protein L5 [Candidatus Portnoybacteria bacterium RBG_13_40_8]OGZ35570.1 MAG: 50S ribosomal protein L5 [Candidatus Portnoybacteria bacterium RIFCSPHIGHO2_01_FULL_39_19]
MLQEKYKKEIVLLMKEKFGYKNNLAVPKIKKVVVNIGTGSFSKDEQTRQLIAKDLTLITGQKPVSTLSKKDISAFKIRQGMVVGMKVTIRGKRMFDFISRLINIVLPRIRDFRGLSPDSIDKSGNLNIGIREYIIFPELSGEDIKKIFGLEVTVVTDAKKREEATELFKLMGFPIKSE